MMSKGILILCLQLAVITAFAGGNDHGMNGRVKKVTEKTYFASEGPLSHGESLDLGTTYIRSYDEQGRLTEEIKGEAFRTPGIGKEIKSENKKIYTYNDKGWLLKIEERSVSGEREYNSLYEYIYDEHGRCVLEIFSRGDEKKYDSKTMYVTTYNGSGSVAEVVTIVPVKEGGGHREIGRQKNEYNEAGKPAENWFYDYKQNKYILSTGYSYDTYGRQIEKRQYGSDGELRSLQTSKYDREGRKTEMLTKNGESNIIKAEFSYEDIDKNGNPLKETIATAGKSPRTITRQIEYYP